MTLGSATESVVARPNRAYAHGNFYLANTLVLALLVFLGFAPTFYLDPLFTTREDQASFPLYLLVHAIILTLWYVGLAFQALLIARGNKAMHRQTGYFLVAIAAGVVISGVIATFLAIPRATELGFPPRAMINTLVTSNTVNLLLFTVLLTIAFVKRQRPQVHMRLMLLASITIIGPAIGPGRLFGGTLQSLFSSVISIPIPLYFWVFLVLPLIVFDFRTLGRIHRATLWGVGAKAVSVLITISLGSIGMAGSYVDWLETLA